VLFRCLLELEIGRHMSSLARSFSKLIRRLSPFGHVHLSPEARSKGCIKTCQRLYSTFSRQTGRRSNVKDLIRKKENQRASNRQCSHLEESCICVLLANQTQRTPDLAECSASGRS
jgi:hypothetical protein